MDKIISVKLITQEEIVGILKKEYSVGDLRLANVMVVCPGAKGIFLDPYMIGGDNSELEIRAHAVITSSPATEKIIELFTQTTTYNEKRAAEATRDKVVN